MSGITVIPSILGKSVFHIGFCGVHVSEGEGRMQLDEKKVALEGEFVIIPTL